MIFIGPTGCCQLEHLVVVMTEIWNIDISSLSFMLSGAGGVQLCVFESKRLPGPPWPPPGPGQPASSSRGVTTIGSRCALAPLQPQKWFWRYVSHQWSKESSSESSQNFHAASSERQSCWQDALESKRRGLEAKVNIRRSNADGSSDSYKRGLRPHVQKICCKVCLSLFFGWFRSSFETESSAAGKLRPLMLSINITVMFSASIFQIFHFHSR